VPEIYHRTKKHQSQVVPETEFSEAKPLGPVEQSIVDLVWTEYAKFSATELSAMTHRERPWIEARGDTLTGINSSSTIGPESLDRYFYELAQAKGGGIDPRTIWRGEEQYLSGAKLFSAEEVFAE
jgi:hypothetical protein